MSQTNYDYYMVVGQSGQLRDLGNDNVLSYAAIQEIGYGLGLARGPKASDCRLPAANIATISFDADFVTSNEISLDVNGVTVGPVVFDTDQATTIALVADAISALDNTAATVSDTREITVTRDDGSVTIANISVTSGASQANGSTAYSANNSFIGVSVFSQAQEQTLSGNDNYKATESVSVLTQGRIYVYVEQDVNVADSVYVRHTTNGANTAPGQFRKDADSSNATLISGARFITDASAGSVAVLEINLPN